MSTYRVPGIYPEEVTPRPPAELRTGVPAFLGFAASTAPAERLNTPHPLTLWPQLEQRVGPPAANSYLGNALRGFFENGGGQCYVVYLDPRAEHETALRAGLAALEPLDTVDLVCVPDIMQPDDSGVLLTDRVLRLQTAVLDHCDRLGDRFAILDSWPTTIGTGTVLDQRKALNGTNGALYYPWVKVSAGGTSTAPTLVPPCGHVAGIYAVSDQRVGVHKAPANEALAGVLDLEVTLTNSQQGELNPVGINCLRAFPGRGIRVWGARTLSTTPNWTYVNVRRLFLTAGRWIERNMPDASFEPNAPALWARITRELSAYFEGLFRQGAFTGSTAQQAFYVKCDAETNPASVREAGQVVTEVGLAPAVPGEFIRVYIVNSPGGVSITSSPGTA